MPRIIPKLIRHLLGINRRDGADKVQDNEFFTLQNWMPTLKGLLYKRPGTTEDLSAADLYGADRVTGVYRYHEPNGDRFTLYHCRPNSTPLPQPTTDLILDEITSGDGDIFAGGPRFFLYVCYTWVGLGMESNYNSLTRGGFVAISASSPVDAWDQPGHQKIMLLSNTNKLKVTIPAFPTGVRSANIFVARGDSIQMTYMGTITQTGGNLLIEHFISPDGSEEDDIDTDNITLAANNTAGGKLKNGNYYISLAWMVDAVISEGKSIETGLTISFLTPAKLITLNGEEDSISVSCDEGTSTNGAKAFWVFISTHDEKKHSMICVGTIKSDGVTPFVIDEIPNNSNAQSHPSWQPRDPDLPADGRGEFAPFVMAGNAQNTNRFGFFLKKDQDDVVSEVLISRTEAEALGFGYGFATGNIIRTDGDTVGFSNLTVEHPTITNWRYYLEPSFAAQEGLAFFVNGADYIRLTNGKSISSLMIEPYTITNPTPPPDNLPRPTTPPPLPNLIVEFDNSLVVSGAKCKNAIYYSNANQFKNWVTGGSGTALRFAQVGDPFGKEVKGLSIFSYTTGTDGPASFLIVVKKSSLWSYSSLPDTSGLTQLSNMSGRVGTVSYRSIVHTPMGTVFVGNDGDIYLIRGAGEPMRIGGRVRPILEHLGEDDSLAKKVTASFHKGFYKVSYCSTLSVTENDQQLYADFRTSRGNPITWSGPHIGIGVGPQVVLSGEGDDDRRLAAQSNALPAIRLDDTSTFQDLGNAIVSVVEGKTYRFGAEFHLKRFMSLFAEAHYDTQYTHNLLMEAFADEKYTQSDKEISDGAGIWDSSSWDQASWGGALYRPIVWQIGPTNLIGRTFKFKLTHSNNAQFIIATIGMAYRPERRMII